MAEIREELVLVDRFSAVFNQYLGLLARASGAGTAAAASQAQFQAAAQAAGDSLGRMAGAGGEAARWVERTADSLQQAGVAGDQAADRQERVNRSFQRGKSAASGLERRLLSLAKAYLGLRSAQAFVNLSDAMVETTARLDRMNDGLQTTAELNQMIYEAAQRSRGAYRETADLVSKLGTMASEAFSSNAELVAFAEQINKQMALAGTNPQGAQAAMLQLTQAMSSGVLRGEELNSILEQAPTIAQSIAKYLGVSVGQMREMASQGQITAQVVKAAMFAAAEETNAAFADIPLTFGQAWIMAGNAAVMAFQPALEKLNGLLNSDLGKGAVNGLISGFELLGKVAEGAVGLMASGARWVADHWELASTLLQFAAGALLAFTGLSVALALKNAAAWALAHIPLLLFAAIIGALAIAVFAASDSCEAAFGRIGSALGWLYAFGYNIVAAAWNLIAAFAEFFANVFDNPAAAVANLFLGLFNFIMDVVSNAAGAIDALLGSNISGAVRGFQANVNEFVTGVFGENKVKIQRMDPMDHAGAMASWSAAFSQFGAGLDSFQVKDFLGGLESGGPIDYEAMLGNIPADLGAIKADTGALKRSVSLSEEDMKLLVDMAERRYVNHINLTAQTPIINVTGQNTGDTGLDRQRLADALQRILLEQSASHTDLSYV